VPSSSARITAVDFVTPFDARTQEECPLVVLAVEEEGRARVHVANLNQALVVAVVDLPDVARVNELVVVPLTADAHPRLHDWTVVVALACDRVSAPPDESAEPLHSG